jgi:hypothetical protein
MADSPEEQTPPPELPEELQRILPDLSPSKRTEVLQYIFSFMTRVDKSAGPPIDPETVHILTASIDKDNEYKFKYLSQKQADSAVQEGRDHEFATERHRDGIKLLKPIIYAAIFVVLGSILAGIYFIGNGREAVGSSLLTGTFGALAGFLGGLGTSKFVRPDR